MKNTLLPVLCFFIIFQSALTQGFVEEFRSPENQRPPLSLFSNISNQNWAINDLNNDGTPEIFSRKNNTIIVRDGISKMIIRTWKVEEGEKFRGLYRFNNSTAPETPTHRVIELEDDSSGGSFKLLNHSTGEVEFAPLQPAEFITVADIDTDGLPEVFIAYETWPKQIVIIGWDSDGFNSSDAESSLAADANTASEYILNLKYESESKMRFVNSISPSDNFARHDLNGDGTPEIVTFTLDENDMPAGLIVRNGQSKAVVWSYMFPADYMEELQGKFHGFHDANGDGTPEAIFGNRTVVTIDKNVHSLDANFEILKVLDLNNDGYAELIGRGLADSTVQIWGKAVSSAIDQASLEQKGFQLLPNYPNPFTISTQIPFELEEAAEVRIDIYDINGRFIENLTQDFYPAGQHQVEWSTTTQNGNTALYICRMKIGGQSHSQVIIQQ